ncbi:MAG: PhoH family protein [Candidatus Omnitrophica bacterium]|nr:PhoH family protein [Candidatus Omnitrophota bacterium]
MQKNYVIDTSVLLDNPKCLEILHNGQENNIYLPYAVVRELDGLKKDKRLSPVVSRVVDEIEENDFIKLIGSESPNSTDGDLQILEDIRKSNIDHPILVTNDKLFRVLCKYYNIASEPFEGSIPYQSESQLYTGFHPGNNGFIHNSFTWEKGKPVLHISPKESKTIDYEHKVWNVRPLNVYQNLAFELMLSPHIHLVSIQSKAGFGKSYISLATAMQEVIQEKHYEKIYLIKPTIEVGESLGFLPGDVEDKVDPYVRYLRSLIYKLHMQRGSKCSRVFTDDSTPQKLKLNPEFFEILPIAYIRGMNIENAFVIVDETQNLSRVEVRSLLTRMSHGTKCVCLGDVEQIDNRYLNKYNNGLNWIVKTCLGEPGYGHIVLKGDRSRGPICDIVIRNGL